MAGDARAVNRRVGIDWTNEDLDLGIDAGFFFGGFADDGEGADAFAVEALSCHWYEEEEENVVVVAFVFEVLEDAYHVFCKALC